MFVTDYGSGTVSVVSTGPGSVAPTGPERAPAQQFSVPAGTTAGQCAGVAPTDVDWPGLVGMHDRGWQVSYAAWPNSGTGVWVCTRQPSLTGTTWTVRPRLPTRAGHGS